MLRAKLSPVPRKCVDKLDMSFGAFFKPAPEMRRTPLFRFSLMVIRPDSDPALRRTSTTWSALKGEPFLPLVPGNLVQQFVDKHLARAGVVFRPRAVFNNLDTLIAMVKVGEGIAVIPSQRVRPLVRGEHLEDWVYTPAARRRDPGIRIGVSRAGNANIPLSLAWCWDFVGPALC